MNCLSVATIRPSQPLTCKGKPCLVPRLLFSCPMQPLSTPLMPTLTQTSSPLVVELRLLVLNKNNFCWPILSDEFKTARLNLRTQETYETQQPYASPMNPLGSFKIKTTKSRLCLEKNLIKFPAAHLDPSKIMLQTIQTTMKEEQVYCIFYSAHVPVIHPMWPKEEDNDSLQYEPHEEDEWIIQANFDKAKTTFTAYKRVDRKIHPVSTAFPEGCEVNRCIPEDPLLTMKPLPFNPPVFTPTKKITQERLEELKINSTGFLLPEEEKLFQHIMMLNEEGIAFEDIERGTFKESYFSPYIIPTVPHIPWEHQNSLYHQESYRKLLTP